MNSLLLIERTPPFALLTLNRPARHNSLVPALLQELLAALNFIEGDEMLRAVVLQANGPSFSTGGDLQGFVDHLDSITDYAGKIVGLLNQTMLAMQALPVPIVAAVDGLVTGGSLGLVLAADLVLVSPMASFIPYYSEVGFSPDGGWTAWLPEIIGPTRAADVLMNNLTITAEQAVAWGLANRQVPHVSLRKAALEMANTLAVRPPGSLKRTKSLLNPEALEEKLEQERTNFVAQIADPGTRENMLAFLASMKV